MSEKEINQLKRGRVQGKNNGPQRSPSVGEIADPASVLNDSISQGRQQPNPNSRNRNEYSPSEHSNKTTTVDPISESSEEVTDATHRRSHSPRNDGYRTSRPARSQSRRSPQDTREDQNCTYPANESESVKPSTPTKCSCPCKKMRCIIKDWFRKILNFLGFKSACGKKCDRNKENSSCSEKRSTAEGARYRQRPRNNPRNRSGNSRMQSDI